MYDGQDCLFTPVFDILKWFEKDTDDTLCIYLREVLTCEEKGPEDCTGDCELSKGLVQGKCWASLAGGAHCKYCVAAVGYHVSVEKETSNRVKLFVLGLQPL